jgi:hypothetical protein
MRKDVWRTALQTAMSLITGGAVIFGIPVHMLALCAHVAVDWVRRLAPVSRGQDRSLEDDAHYLAGPVALQAHKTAVPAHLSRPGFVHDIYTESLFDYWYSSIFIHV